MATATAYEAPPKPPTDEECVVFGLHMMGLKNREIAERTGKSQSTVSDWINRGYKQGYFDKLPHPREFGLRLECRCADNPIPNGQAIVCVKCAASGYDFHPRMHAPPLPKDPPRKLEPDPKGLKGGK